ncbi:MAG: hypothetical protein KGQ41_05990 [Alphaproteobacteria bacterium]|nr:hypothetical protein [Alphaproteobacteria bacterium]
MQRHFARVAIYADQSSKASPSPIDQELKRTFPDAIIERVDRHDIAKPSLYRDLLMFVLPGIQGETSLYHEHVGPSNHLIQHYIASGGRFFGQCAGACYAASNVRFTPEWAPAKRRDAGLLGLFNGVAHGPLPGLGVDGEDPRYYRGLTHANITLELADYSHTLPLVYTSGPTFIPHAGQRMNVIGRYADADNKPAIISFDYGRGFVLLSGPVPQNGATPPTGIPQFATLDVLLELLAPFEDQRVALFDRLMRMMKHHSRMAGLHVA